MKRALPLSWANFCPLLLIPFRQVWNRSFFGSVKKRFTCGYNVIGQILGHDYVTLCQRGIGCRLFDFGRWARKMGTGVGDLLLLPNCNTPLSEIDKPRLNFCFSVCHPGPPMDPAIAFTGCSKQAISI